MHHHLQLYSDTKAIRVSKIQWRLKFARTISTVSVVIVVSCKFMVAVTRVWQPEPLKRYDTNMRTRREPESHSTYRKL